MVTDPWIFFGVAGIVMAYLIYMLIRKRKGERRGYEDNDGDL